MDFPSSSAVKNLPAMQETQFNYWGDLLEKERATLSSIHLVNRIDRRAWGLHTVHGVAKEST